MSGARPDPAAGDVPVDERGEKRVRPRFTVDLDRDGGVEKAESAEERRKRNAHPDNRAARREYMHSEEGRAANRKAQENYRRDHPERVDAQQKARSTHGESGETNHKCAKCDAKGTHKHHTDYNGGPVQWLCHTHHVKAHHPKSDLGKSETSTMSKSSDATTTLEPFAKCGGSMDRSAWYDKYYATPLYAEALQVERDYLARERDAVQYAAPKQTGPSAWEKYDEARRKLELKALDLKIKEAKKVEKSMTSNDLFKSILGRDAFAVGPTDLSKALPPAFLKKPGAGKGDDGDAKDDKPGADASPADKKKAFLDKFKKALDDAKKALDALDSVKKSLSSVPMVDHPRPGATSTIGATDGGDPTGANKTTVPMVDHPRPGGGGAMDKSEKKKADIDDEYAEAMGKARSALDTCMKSFVGYAELGDGLGTNGGPVGAVTPGQGQSAPAGEPFGTLGSMNGMPSPEQGAESQLSEDDTSIEGEHGSGQKPLASHAPGGAASGLVTSVHQVMGGDVSAGSGSVEGSMSKSGALAPNAEYARQLAARRQATADGVRAIVGSGSEDVRIAGILEKSQAAGRGGNVQFEPVQLRPRRVDMVYRPGILIPND